MQPQRKKKPRPIPDRNGSAQTEAEERDKIMGGKKGRGRRTGARGARGARYGGKQEEGIVIDAADFDSEAEEVLVEGPAEQVLGGVGWVYCGSG